MNEPQDQLEISFRQLELVLSFFPRVETALSVVLGVDLAMLAFLASNPPALSGPAFPVVLAAIAVSLLGGGLRFVYLGYFPQLEGGGASLVYFRTIAERTEPNFRDQWRSTSADTLVNDVLGQVWRNSEILATKYKYLRFAFIALSVAVVPWLASIVLIMTA